MDRKLASIQRIIKIEPIEGADQIEKAAVLGWQVVVMKGEFKEGDLGVYCEVDSFLPIKPEFEFLRKSSYRKLTNGEEGFRLRTVKLRKQISQGLLLPISILDGKLTFSSAEGVEFTVEKILTIEEGTDVSKILSIVKYEPPIPAQLSGQVLGNFPGFIPKTDEMRVQSCPAIINELKGKPYYISTKADGTSATFYLKDEHFGVCSRNLELKENDTNSFWLVARKCKIEELLRGRYKDTGIFYAIQAELIGPGIQKNPMLLKEIEIRVFSIYNISEGMYLSYFDFVNFCKDTFEIVNIEESGNSFNYTAEQLLEKAKGTYESGRQKEGIVVRPITEMYSEALGGRLSFKVINNDYLLKEEN